MLNPNPISSQEPDLSGIRPRTQLGEQLLQRRRAIVASGIPLLTWREIDEELNEQRRDP